MGRKIFNYRFLFLILLFTGAGGASAQVKFNTYINRAIDANYSGHISDVEITFDGGYVAVCGSASLVITKFASSGAVLWSKDVAWGGGIYYARHVVQLKDSGYAVTGTGGPGYNPTSTWQIGLMRLDKNGNLLWVETFGGAGGNSFNMGSHILQSLDGGLLTVGQYNSTGILIKTDINGNQQWANTYSQVTRLRTAFQNADSSYVVWGIDDGSSRIIKIVVDKQGNVLSSTGYSIGNFSQYLSVKQTSDKGYIVQFDLYGTSTIMMKTDSTDKVQWANVYYIDNNANNTRDPRDVEPVSGGYVFAGENFTNPAGNTGFSTAFWAKVDYSGKLLWIRDYQTSYWGVAYSVKETADKGLVIWSSMFSTGSSIVADLTKTDSLGNSTCTLYKDTATVTARTFTPAALTVTATAVTGLTVQTNSYSGASATGTSPCIVKPQAQFTADRLTVCTGDTVNFTDQSSGGPTTWQWTFTGGTPSSSNNESPSVVYNAPNTYAVKLVVSNAIGADSLTKTAYITVNSPPVVTVMPADTAVCSGSTFALTAKGAYSYAWFTSTGLSSDTGATVTGATPGPVTYSVIGNSGGCYDTAQAVIHVLPAPVAGKISAPVDSICAGGNANLTVSDSLGRLQWQISTDGIAFADIAGDSSSASYSKSVMQTSYYRVIGTTGCGADTTEVFPLTVFRISPPVVIASDTAICSSDSAKIQTSQLYQSYRWNNADTLYYTYANSAGGYWVSVTDANGCTAVSDHKNISVYPVPSVSMVVQGDTLSSLNSDHNQWYFNGHVIPGATSSVYVATDSGNYSVQVTDTNGCQSSSQPVFVAITGVADISAGNRFAVYPNPFRGLLFIERKNVLPEIRNIQLEDITGRKIISPILRGGDMVLPVDVSEVCAGTYFLKIETASGVYSFKVIKQ